MADPAPSSAPRRLAPATLVLIVAAVLAVAAVAVAIVRSNGADSAPATNTMAGGGPGGSPGDEVHNFVAQLQESVRRNPEDDAGWYQLGLAYRQIGQYEEAERAFRRAMELQPRNADYVAYLGETLLLRGGATPPPEAEQMFRRALELEPGNAQARYYLATLKDFHGDHRAALDDLVALLRSAPADAAWYGQVRQAATAIAERNHIDVADRLPPARQSARSVATAAIPGPSQEQMRAATAIPPSQQDQMVRGMVDRLAARLRQNPRDADGWIRLMRSRMVLNDAPGARQALQSGLTAFNGDAATQQRLRDAAGTLGIPTS
jgi:cytochrome c-type biogenesis protein CcmH